MAEDSGDAVTRARALHTQAVSEGRFGHAARAIRTLRRALDVLDRAPAVDTEARQTLTVELWLSLAVNEAEVNGLDRGLAAIAHAQGLAEALGDPALLVRTHNNFAWISTRAGDFDAAVEHFDRALAMLDHATPHDRIYTLLNRGNVHLYRGELGPARRMFTRSAKAAAAEGIADGSFRALHNLGYVEFLAGDLPTALALMDAAAALDVDISRGIWALDRARILVEAGLTRDADQTLAEAWQIFSADRLAQDLGEVEVARAECLLINGDIAGARRFAARARDRFRRRGNRRWTRTAELVLLRGDLAAGRPGSRLAAVAERLEEELASDGLAGPARSAALVGAEALLDAGRVLQADAVIRRLARTSRSQPITERLHANYVGARVDAAQGRGAAASRKVRRALDELAQYQASFGSIDLRTASAVHGRRLAEFDVALALRAGKPAPVFAAAERARAVSSRLAPVRPPEDDAATELLAELRRTVELLRGLEEDPAASAPLLRKRRELEREIIARSWTLAGGGSATRPASLDEVRARLTERGRVMVTYVQVGGALSAVVVGERLRVLGLGSSASVLEQVRRVRADLDVLAYSHLDVGIRAAVRASLERSLAELDNALLMPLGIDGPLVLVSTGVLGQLPWASLPSLRGRSIVVAPSATKWLSSTAVDASAGAVVALAGPELGRGGEETAAVGAAWPGADVLGGVDATAAALTGAMMSADVLHVAAHGVHQPENPLFSSVRMVDGPVFAHELDRNGRAPGHVVLSACEVGLATIRPGDEALGLASVLLHLGTRSVIAGVARVGDEVAAQTMATYHRKLAAGADSSTALAEALVEADTDVTPPFVNFGAAWSANLAAAAPVA